MGFSFLHNIKDTVSPSEACLKSHISWSLAQVYDDSSFGLSQPSLYLKGFKGLVQDSVQKHLVLQPGDDSLAKKPYLDIRAESHQGDRKSAGVNLPGQLTLKKGAIRDCIPDVLRCTTSSPSSSSAGTHKFLGQLRSITFNGFVLNIVKVTIFS